MEEKLLLQRTMFNVFLKRLSIYFLGIFVLGFGVNILIRSTLGAGAWDAVNDNFSVLTHITLGTASFIINVLILIMIIIHKKSMTYLITIVPIFGNAVAMDIWDILLFGSWEPNNLWIQVVAFVVGLLVLPFGLSLLIMTKFPAMVFDEMTFMMMDLTHNSSFMKVRWGIEVFAMALATLFGFLAGIRFGSVNVGTIVISITIGPLIEYYLSLMNYQKKAP